MGLRLTAGACAALFVATAGVSLAQAQPGRPPAPEKKIDETSVRTGDGWTLPITYYQSAGGKETPVVILLHGSGGNRQVWTGVAQRLHNAGYAVVAIDLRKHGDSQGRGGPRGERLTPFDYRGMVAGDLEAVKAFLVREHNAERLNIRKTAIVAADDMAPVAANFAVGDWARAPYPDAPTLAARTPRGQDIRALILLSPSEGAGGLNLGQALPRLRGDGIRLAAWIVVGTEDKEDDGTAEKAYERITAGGAAGKDRVVFDRFDRVAARGTELLKVRNVNLEARIVAFLDKHLKSLNGPNDRWRTRKSRLE